MSTRSPSEDVPVQRIDRILAFMSLGIALLSVLCFFAIMIATASGVRHADFATGVWPVVSAIPMFGLPVAFILILILLVTSFVRRGRASKKS